MLFDADQISVVLCDLDGVVWLAHEPIAGSVKAIARIRSTGRRVMFVTNNSSKLIAEQEDALGAIGVPAAGDVVSSAMAGALLVEPGERVLVAGGPGVIEAVERRGAIALLNDGETDHGPVDAVVVGLHREFDYWRLSTAAKAVMNGARLIGTNSDTTFPTPHGLEPGGGSLVAAVATVAGVEAIMGGKPERPMAEVILKELSTELIAFHPRHALMVGDRLDTDGLFAEQLGSPFALVRSGVIQPGAPVDATVAIDLDVADLAAVAAALG